MDNSFLKKDSPEALQQIITRTLFDVNTSMPGTVKSFNAKNQVAVVTPNIRMIQNSLNGTSKTIQMPDLIEVPCIFPYSTTSGFSLTFPVKVGDQCLLIFSQRSIDNWHKYGRVQDPVEKNFPRAHSLSDAICIVGLIAKPNAISDFSEDSIEIRNKTRRVRVRVKDTEVEVMNCAGINPTKWIEETTYFPGSEVSIESGRTFVAKEENSATYPLGNEDKWLAMPFSLLTMNDSSVILKSPTITLEGDVIVAGTMSGIGGVTPVATIAGIVHKGATPDKDIVIDKDHIHKGVTTGTGKTKEVSE